MLRRIILLILILLSGISCSFYQENTINTSEGVIQMPVDTNADDLKFMVETYGFSEEELEGLDLAKLIQDYQLRTRDYSAEEVRDILKAEGDMYVDDGTTALFSIFAIEGRDLRDGDEVNRIGYYFNAGTLVQRLVIDIDDKAYYIDNAEPHPLKGKQVEFLKDLPHKYEISNWEKYTVGEEQPSTGHFSWKLVFGLTSGEYCVYDGYTKDMSHLPATFNDFIEGLNSVLND